MTVVLEPVTKTKISVILKRMKQIAIKPEIIATFYVLVYKPRFLKENCNILTKMAFIHYRSSAGILSRASLFAVAYADDLTSS